MTNIYVWAMGRQYEIEIDDHTTCKAFHQLVVKAIGLGLGITFRDAI